jgi:hypothetical protein
MTPQEFSAKWASSELKERAGSQEHFIDVCRLVGAPTPAEADPKGEFFTFERGVVRGGAAQAGPRGFADVWLRDHFAWEYKGKHKNLTEAYAQLQLYREDLENPPLSVVCDMDHFEIHTNFERRASEVYSFTNEQIGSVGAEGREALRLLRALFSNPDSLKPGQTREAITEEVAGKFATLAEGLRDRGEEPHRVAHFLMKLVFCLFAEDIGLLPDKLFTRMVGRSAKDPEGFQRRAQELFAAMATGGEVAYETIRHFNGGLFADDDALGLTHEEIRVLVEATRLDWSSVEPAIFGTLFERSLDPERRSELGAQYTSKDDVLRIVEPVLMAPLRREWEGVRAEVEELMQIEHAGDLGLARGATLGVRTRAVNRAIREAQGKLDDFASKLRMLRVLDPACGSGNFLYVSLNELLDLEKEVATLAGRAGLGTFVPEVSPDQLSGIEKDPYARELTQVSIWIGYLQWLKDNGFGSPPDPILGTMTNVVEMDAILATDGEGNPIEPEWPEADIVVGNPPFLGSRRMRPVLGDEYCDGLMAAYSGRIDGLPDLVCYWFERARGLIEEGQLKRAGLIATQAIRNPANRKVLKNIKASGDIFMAWQDEPWVLDGADVRISIVGFDDGTEQEKTLDGEPVPAISARLRAGVDISEAPRLPENLRISFQGVVMRGPFDLDTETAHRMLRAGGNPNGRPNSDVVRRRRNARDITGRSRVGYAVDFGVDMPIEEAAGYEAPFAYVEKHVYPKRQEARQAAARDKWWIFWNARRDMREALRPLSRYVVTPRVSKHRVFAWLEPDILPDTRLIVFARDDDYFFGVLHSTIHEAWALERAQKHGVGNDPTYNNTDCFETFPLPWPPSQEPKDHPLVEEIAHAARNLVEQRARWLNPPDLQTSELKKRTLTNLYNERPAWLNLSHARLDRAVFAAYGWPEPPEELPEEEMLARLLALNLERYQVGQENL